MNRPRRILVIADDFTGAAEIAGIGARHGLSCEIVRDATGGSTWNSSDQLLVIDTDSRSLAPASAAQRVRKILGEVDVDQFDLVFKKIDSLLRGPVLAEIGAAMQALNKPAAIIAPANPSRGRTIEGGEYRVDGTPLHQTALANDPEYPRRSSRVVDLVGTVPENVAVADSTSSSDVQRWAEQVDDNTLAVGAADFFAAILASRGFSAGVTRASLGSGRILMVCGSMSESSSNAVRVAMSQGVRVFQITDKSYDMASAIQLALSEQSGAIVTGGAVLQNIAQTVGHVLDATMVDELLIEGGSTSAAILEQMKWRRFTDCTELGPGIVRMSVVGHRAHLTVKPGSYPWPDEVWQRLMRAINPAT